MLVFNSSKTYFKRPNVFESSQKVEVTIASAHFAGAKSTQRRQKNNERQQKLSAVIEWQWHRLHMLNGMLAFFTCTHSNNFRMFWHYFSLFSPNFHFVCSNSSLSRLHGDIVLASKIYVIRAIWFGSLSFSLSP